MWEIQKGANSKSDTNLDRTMERDIEMGTDGKDTPTANHIFQREVATENDVDFNIVFMRIESNEGSDKAFGSHSL